VLEGREIDHPEVSRMTDRRILVIANRTCPCPGLADEVAARAGDPAGSVRVVAPALNSRLRHWVSDVDAAIAAARERLARAVANLAERGIAAEGVVGDSDPLLAIEDALADFQATELVLSTHPPGHSNWLEKNLPARAAQRFDLPVTHLVSSYGLEQGPALATGSR
jgi:hypothetical protein